MACKCVPMRPPPPRCESKRSPHDGSLSLGSLASQELLAGLTIKELEEMSSLVLDTAAGTVRLVLRPDSAPVTCSYITRCVGAKLFDGVSFYRSDFVIQTGLYGSGRSHAFGDLPVNETSTGVVISNTRGAAPTRMPVKLHRPSRTLCARLPWRCASPRLPSRNCRDSAPRCARQRKHGVLHQSRSQYAPGYR